MVLLDFLFILSAYVIAAAIKGLTGIGFSTSCLPIMALRIDLTAAIPLVIVPSVISNIAVMVQAGRFREAVRRFWPLYLTSIPGLLAGLAILVAIDANAAKAVLGMVLIAYSLWALTNTSLTISATWEKRLRIPVGLCTGLVNGITGSQVMPVLPFLFSLNLGKKAFIQAINISFTLSSLIMLGGMNHLGYVSAKALLIAAGGLIPVIVSVYLAGRLQEKLSGTWHRRLVLLFLLIMGLILLMRIIPFKILFE